MRKATLIDLDVDWAEGCSRSAVRHATFPNGDKTRNQGGEQNETAATTGRGKYSRAATGTGQATAARGTGTIGAAAGPGTKSAASRAATIGAATRTETEAARRAAATTGATTSTEAETAQALAALRSALIDLDVDRVRV